MKRSRFRVTADISKLAEVRVQFHSVVNDFEILAETLTLSPVALAYRQGDAQWAAIADWTVYALVQAEASGITEANLNAMSESDDPVSRFRANDDEASKRFDRN